MMQRKRWRLSPAEKTDIWFRYASNEDIDRWAKFLVDKLPHCFREVEKWDEQTPRY